MHNRNAGQNLSSKDEYNQYLVDLVVIDNLDRIGCKFETSYQTHKKT